MMAAPALPDLSPTSAICLLQSLSHPGPHCPLLHGSLAFVQLYKPQNMSPMGSYTGGCQGVPKYSSAYSSCSQHRLPHQYRGHLASNPRPYPGLTISKECVSKVEAAYNTRKGVIGRPRFDAALHRCHLQVMWAGLLCQLCIGLLQLEGPELLDMRFQKLLLPSVQQASPSMHLLLSSLHRVHHN